MKKMQLSIQEFENGLSPKSGTNYFKLYTYNKVKGCPNMEICLKYEAIHYFVLQLLKPVLIQQILIGLEVILGKFLL